MATSYSNPIVGGFAPDPSVICVDDTFFLVNSSFHVFPGLPIYASKNLKSWTQIGNAINRRSQLSLDRAGTFKVALDTGFTLYGTIGLAAPTIRYHKGTFYIICTNLSVTEDGGHKQDNYYLTCTDIWAGNWSDPIWYEWNGIDPSLFFDDDDRAYIQGHWILGDRTKQPTGTIMQAEVDIATGKLLSEPKEIWGGYAKYDTEGPHTYKKDGYYYLLVAEGGTFEHHLLSMARSKDIWGPYESYEHNPVLTADGKDEYIQNTGHGEIFQDPQGLWWAAVLAVRQGPEGRFPLSRETFLTPVDWPTGGWPSVRQPRIEMTRDESQILQLPALTYSPAAQVDLIHIRDHISENYSISGSDKSLRIIMAASEANLSTPFGTSSFVGKRQRKLDDTFSASLNHSTTLDNTKIRAGIAVYKDKYRFAELFYSYDTREIILSWIEQATGSAVTAKTSVDLDEYVQFKITASELEYSFWYCVGGEEWLKLGSMNSIEISARDFTGPIFGVFASGTEGSLVEFDNVALE